jgi:hypothetical protein
VVEEDEGPEWEWSSPEADEEEEEAAALLGTDWGWLLAECAAALYWAALTDLLVVLRRTGVMSMMGPEVKENSDWQGEKVRSSSLKEASVKQKLESAVKCESTRWRLLEQKSSSTSSSKRGSNVGNPWLAGIKPDASKVLDGEKSPLSIILCSSSSPAHKVGKQGKTLLGTVRVRGSQTLASTAERGIGDGDGDNDGHAELESR